MEKPSHNKGKGGFLMRKNIDLTLIALFVTFSFFNIQVFAQSADEVPWKNYPDNSFKKFDDVNTFYESLAKKEYVEFEDAKMNIRAKVHFKDINTILSKVDEYGKSRKGGLAYHPNRQVYVLITVSNDGKEIKISSYDAEKKRLI